MRKVLVTGGSRGIGLAIASRLAAAGFDVIAVARRESEEFRTAVRARGEGAGSLHFRAFDLGEVDAIPAFVKGLRDEFGAIYGLVNNAGLGTEGVLATMRNVDIEALIRLNVLSPVMLTKYVVRHMMADGCGRIVNISSIIASTGYNGLSVYGATKAAATGFTRSLAREVGKLGITVNAIAPGFIDTEMTHAMPFVTREVARRLNSLQQAGLPVDVAETAAWLASPSAGGVNGQVLRVCGQNMVGA
jgi:3-oxoacyl-[acyl-carrier protein] reductase